MRRHCKRILDQFRNGEAFTNLYTGVGTTKPQQKKCRLKRRLRSIYKKIAAQPLLQNIADKLENEFNTNEENASGENACRDNLGIGFTLLCKSYCQVNRK